MRPIAAILDLQCRQLDVCLNEHDSDSIIPELMKMAAAVSLMELQMIAGKAPRWRYELKKSASCASVHRAAVVSFICPIYPVDQGFSSSPRHQCTARLRRACRTPIRVFI